MQKYMDGVVPTAAELKTALRKATVTGALQPVVCGSAFKNKGVQQLLDAVVAYLPSPLDIPAITGVDEDGKELIRETKDDAPFAGLVFKIMTDPFVGQLAFFRVYSGHLDAGSPVFAAVLPRAEARSLGLDHPNAGDLVVVAAGETTLRQGFSEKPDAPLFVPAEPPGQHGFAPDPELDGIFFQVGDGIAPKKLPVVRSIDVAALVAARLGITPPGKGR